MKLFEYKCMICGKRKEIWAKEPPKEPPKCYGAKMVRQYSVMPPKFNCDMRR